MSLLSVRNVLFVWALLSLCVNASCTVSVGVSHALRRIMSGKYTKHDNIVRVVELHKVGKKYRKIAEITGVNEKTVSGMLQK